MAFFSISPDIDAIAHTSSRHGNKFHDIAAYAALALIAMAVAIPAAIATSGTDNAGLFTECFSATCEQSDALALLNK